MNSTKPSKVKKSECHFCFRAQEKKKIIGSDWMFVSSQNSPLEILIPKWWCWEMGLLLGDKVIGAEPYQMGLVLHKRNTRALPWALFCHIRTQQEAICQPGSRPSPDTKPANTIILDFQASRTVRKKFCCLKSIQSMEFFLYQPEGIKITFKFFL